MPSRLGRVLRALAATLAASALAGCGSFSWRDFTLNPVAWFDRPSAATKPAPLPPLPAESLRPRVVWQAAVGKSGLAVFSPAVAGDSVYAAAQDGTVVRLDAETGRQIWRQKAGSQLSGGVGAGENLVVVGTPEGEVVALDGDGEQRWRARVSSEVLSAPLVVGDIVVARSADNRIFALDARDGRRRWVFQRNVPPLLVRTPVGVSGAPGLVIAGFPGGKMVGLAPGNGVARWEATVAQPKGTTELERIADVVGAPWVAEREVCAVAYQGRIGCFDLGSGNPYWLRELSSTTGVLGDPGLVLASDDKGAVHALDRATGRSLWKQDKLANRQLSAPLPLGQQIAVADGQGFVHFLSRDSGAFVGRTPTDGSAISANPVAVPGGFLVQTRNGTLYRMAVE
jgi:outer membrane protein assembly factor BamB